MAWTNITNAQLAIGAPLRSIDLLALRDNITAQANGDAGSPQQQTNGIANSAVTAAKINYGSGLGASGLSLVVVAPTFNTVGSYAYSNPTVAVTTNIHPGTSLAAGTGANQVYVENNGPNGISGTWRWMTGSKYSALGDTLQGLICRVA